MNPDVERVLRAINRRFYDRHADHFDATRERPWPGWQRVAECFLPTPGAVLDAGCGNGRFGAFLAGHWGDSFRYVGLDSCQALLRSAAQRLDGLIDAPALHRLDVLEGGLDRAIDEEPFDLAVLFGVLHHVPGIAHRQNLLRRLSSRLSPGGILVASLWRLDPPRFARRVVPWATYNARLTRRGEATVDLEALDTGDVLLTWGGDAEHPRYCHFPDETEVDALADAPGRDLIDRFEADGPSGRDNLYLVWR